MNVYYMADDKDVIIKNKEQQIEILEKRIEQASSTIDNQNSMISNFSLIFTVIAIAIPLITALVTYLIAIRPANIALKNFNKKTEDKIQKFIDNKELNEIDEAIILIQKDEDHFITQGFLRLFNSKPSRFSDKHVKKLIQIIKSNKDMQLIELNMIHLFQRFDNKYIQKYFKSVLQRGYSTGHNNITYAAIKYYSKLGLQQDSIPVFTSFLENSDVDHWFLAYKLVVFPYDCINLVSSLHFLNDESVIDRIKQEALTSRNLEDIITTGKQYFNQYYVDVKFEDTLYYDTFLDFMHLN